MNILLLLYTLLAIFLFIVTDVLLSGRLLIIRNIAIGITYYLCVFMIASLVLFAFGLYSIITTNTILAIIAILTILIIFFRKYKNIDALKQIEPVRYMPVALIVVLVVSFLFTFQKFEMNGMGQDQGVYQVNALIMSEGLNSNVLPVKEYDLMTNDEDRQLFIHYLEQQRFTSGGFYSIAHNDNRGTMPHGEYPENSAIFHGLHNFPAILSIAGQIFGAEYIMAGMTLPYLISIIKAYNS